MSVLSTVAVERMRRRAPAIAVHTGGTASMIVPATTNN
jgi:hypothetical protein